MWGEGLLPWRRGGEGGGWARGRGTEAQQNSPNDCKGWQLLQVEGEVEAEAGFEQSGDGFWGKERALCGDKPPPPPRPSCLTNWGSVLWVGKQSCKAVLLPPLPWSWKPTMLFKAVSQLRSLFSCTVRTDFAASILGRERIT